MAKRGCYQSTGTVTGKLKVTVIIKFGQIMNMHNANIIASDSHHAVMQTEAVAGKIDAVAKRFTDVPMLDSMFNSMKTTTHIIDDNRLILQIGDSNFFELIACCDDDGSGFFELISKETIDDIVGELPEEELPDEQ